MLSIVPVNRIRRIGGRRVKLIQFGCLESKVTDRTCITVIVVQTCLNPVTYHRIIIQILQLVCNTLISTVVSQILSLKRRCSDGIIDRLRKRWQGVADGKLHTAQYKGKFVLKSRQVLTFSVLCGTVLIKGCRIVVCCTDLQIIGVRRQGIVSKMEVLIGDHILLCRIRFIQVFI